ncbi:MULTISPECIES: hypothetical protein [unclassified Cupriavidus]|uniref:hypothetical protein n=1 Tax=Cupriavidus sp. H19C3 TaxID=3241603 RepID=UPI003BF8CF82
MEHLIRVQNEYDRQVLGWLRVRVGDAALQSVARRVAVDGQKPYISTICRSLGIRPPSRRAFRDEAAKSHRAVGERYLARIRQILSAPSAPAHAAATSLGTALRSEGRLQGSLF